ncbi:methionyl-tRNA formyltransferase, partial [bacterium]|nr:methionyl-tRNA formyltransferase [bacterium]
MNRIKIVFLGAPDIALPSFEYFINSPDYEVSALVTIKPKAQNRGKKITQRNITLMAQKHNIPVFEPDKISKEPDIINALKNLNPDFFVTFAFGQILSQEVIDIPRIATINLHASLLPEYRGANPIAQSIIDGKTKTGITTMKTVLALDAGDICLQEGIEITPEMNVVDLMELIAKLSPSLLDKTLKGLYQGTLETICQDENCATFTKKLKKEEKVINWDMTALELHNKIRGMYKINTNHTTFNNKIIKILRTNTIPCEGECGCVVDITKEGIIVGCRENSLILL